MANRTAVIETNKGTIKFELLEQDAPKTTENFRLLAEKGYYDGVIFHRVIKNFMTKSMPARSFISDHTAKERWRWRIREKTPTARSFSSCPSSILCRRFI